MALARDHALHVPLQMRRVGRRFGTFGRAGQRHVLLLATRQPVDQACPGEPVTW